MRFVGEYALVNFAWVSIRKAGKQSIFNNHHFFVRLTEPDTIEPHTYTTGVCCMLPIIPGGNIPQHNTQHNTQYTDDKQNSLFDRIRVLRSAPELIEHINFRYLCDVLCICETIYSL